MLYTHFYDIQSIAGSVGVRMFFVISGFLITDILLRESDQIAHGNSVKQVLVAFYMRRLLRIVPALYLMLFIGWCIGLEGLAPTLAWHLLFASNILFILKGDFTPWFSAHLWTISVEEQFYIFWPYAILFLSSRRLLQLTALMSLIALGGRSAALLMQQEGARLLAPAPFALDALAAGAALAVLGASGSMTKLRVKHLNNFASICALALIAILFVPGSEPFNYIAGQWLALAPMAALVWAAMNGMTGLPGKLLSARALVYLGKISYAVYLYHYFLLAAYFQWASAFGFRIYPEGGIRFLLLSASAIAIGAFSWRFVERPFITMKAGIRYNAPSPRGVDSFPRLR